MEKQFKIFECQFKGVVNAIVVVADSEQQVLEHFEDELSYGQIQSVEECDDIDVHEKYIMDEESDSLLSIMDIVGVYNGCLRIIGECQFREQ